MIVHSNAFVFSTCLPAVVFRYGFMFIVFPELLSLYKSCYDINKNNVNSLFF